MPIKKEWVVMIYMAADNDLSDESVWALTEIDSVGLDLDNEYKLGVISLFDSRVQGFKTTAYEFGYGKKFGVLPGQGSNQVDLGDFDSDPSAEVLKQFVIAVQENYPAAHYMLILSGHGSGAVGDFLKSGASFTGMSIPELGEKLGAACQKQDIDILGMDSCVMSMVEVCGELPNEIKYLVGSEGYDPMIGWPYQAIVSKLAKEIKGNNLPSNVTDLRKRVAQLLVDSYTEYYQPYIAAGTSVDIAACDLSKDEANGVDTKEALITAVEALTTELRIRLNKDNENGIDTKVRDSIILAHWRAQSYKKESYTDLWDFCDLLRQDLGLESTIGKFCSKVIDAIDKMVTASRYYGPSFQHSHGLSIYFPWRESEELDEYDSEDNLTFARRTKWGAFLRTYLEISQRERRSEAKLKGTSAIENVELIDIPAMEEGAGILVQMHKIGGPPAKIGGPPAKIGGPPAKIGGPPAKLGFWAKSPSMKNPPNGFLVDKISKKECS